MSAPTLIHDGEDAYIVSADVKEFLQWHSIPEEQFVELIRIMLWHDVHTDVNDALVAADFGKETTTAGREVGWLMHALATKIREEG